MQQINQNLYGIGIGSTNGNGYYPHYDTRAPASTDVLYNVGTPWIYVGNSIWFLLSLSSSGGTLSANWVEIATASGVVLSVTGTANQITAVTTAGNVVLSIPTTFIAPGSIASTTTLTGGTGITATTGNITASTGNLVSTLGSVSAATTVTAGTSITATLGNITATAGNFVSSAAGNGIVLNSGTTSGTTTATLNGRSGQVTITTPSIAAGATFTFTLTNSAITASTTQIIYGLVGDTSGAAVTIQSVTNSASQSVIVFTNGTGATTNTASLILTFLVLN
jgi:hypothetical protein